MVINTFFRLKHDVQFSSVKDDDIFCSIITARVIMPVSGGVHIHSAFLIELILTNYIAYIIIM